jgi:hypothetical protein
MSAELKRATIYFEPELHRAVRLKSVHNNRTISDIVNDSIRMTLQEDQEDLAAVEERSSEPTVTYEEFLAKLKADGKI